MNPGTGTTRVLLVDDEGDLVAYLANRLMNRGLRVVGATSGPEAIEAAGRKTFDVAVVDIKMPVMNGEEVARRLRDLQPFLQVVILTGHASIDSALQCGAQGVFRYLMKPHDFDSLLEVLAQAHSAKQTQQKTRYDQALEDLLEHGGLTPQQIRTESERLRDKYEQ